MRPCVYLLGAVALLAAIQIEAYDFDDTDDMYSDSSMHRPYDDTDDMYSDSSMHRPYDDGTKTDLEDLEADAVETLLIPIDLVQPFPEPKPHTMAEKTALKFKPQLYIEDGCYPYPAVQANGSLSAGLTWSRFNRESCQGSPLGSQVYARSTWYLGKWVVFYAWSFPIALDPVSLFVTGHRHYWQWAIVYTSDMDPSKSIFYAVSLSGDYGITKHSLPGKKFMNSTSVKLQSQESLFSLRQSLKLTERKGRQQDLIMWDQLTPEAQKSLSIHRSPLRANCPLQDSMFLALVEKAYPY